MYGYNKITPMEKKVLTQEELQEVKDLQIENSNLISQFGELEVVIQNLSLKKEELIIKLKELKDREVKIGQTLQDKYGDGNIDIETGEFVSK
jgi:stress response protein YsnF